jgi:acetyltransferase-like isoleucine patch superfamily enzyme
MLRSSYKFLKVYYSKAYGKFCQALCLPYFYLNGVKHKKFASIGLPILDIHPNGTCVFGSGVAMVNKARFATLGKSNRCKLVVAEGAELIIGNNVGMSNTTIVSSKSVIIGNNILMGGGVTITDTDFHSLNCKYWHTDDDLKYMERLPVRIGDNVFIGMNSVVLKGVNIGSNVIIAANSVVTKSIPDKQVWGGNPARFIRNNAQI